MKASLVLMILFLFIMMLSVMCNPRECKSNDDCKFQGECREDRCVCNKDCSKAGHIVLCGDNGTYYLNFCFVMMKSCRLQQEVNIKWVGKHKRCANHDWHPFVPLISGAKHDFPSCALNRNHCANFGVCAMDPLPFCLCPEGYGGSRCEVAEDTDDNDIYIAPQSLVGQPPKELGHQQMATPLFLCVLAAMFSSVVTSAICHRIKNKKMKKLYRNLRTRDGWEDTSKNQKTEDSKTDSNIFENATKKILLLT